MQLVHVSVLFALLAGGGLIATPASAQSRSPMLGELTRCRALTDDAARLACFDAAVRTLEEAERSGEVALVDRAQVREARTRMFGFNTDGLAALGRFGGEPVEVVETTLASARQEGRGAWILTLQDGSVWRQLDAERINAPRPGQPVRIRQAAMGSYLLSVNGARSVRARRER